MSEDQEIKNNNNELVLKVYDNENNIIRPGQYYRRWESEVRCGCCGKMFVKFFMIIGCDEPDIVKDQKILYERLQKSGFDVKIGIEAWCRRCEELDTKIIVPGLM